MQLNKNWFVSNWTYRMLHHSDFDFNVLSHIMYIRRAGKGKNLTYTDALIMADTETSKSKYRQDNHVVAWTISIRAYGLNIVTLWGHKPSTFTDTLSKMLDVFGSDKTLVYFHNLGYDWVFIRKHLFSVFGYPEHQLNTKPYYPISIQFNNGLELRDSYILAQRSLEKWANDLDVEHKKAVGKWDYDKLRNQDEEYSQDELQYIEYDTLAGVECLQATMDNLHKHVYSIPYTATGIPRGESRKRGQEHSAHDNFLRQVMPYDLQVIAETWIYHGGYTHGNRHALRWLWDNDDIDAFDFASSYPFCMLSEKYPCEKFQYIGKQSPAYILKYADNNAFMFKLVMENVRLKNDDIPMPSLQFSKCFSSVNVITDNGRVLEADYIECYMCEQDLITITEQYEVSRSICTDVYVSKKDYLPRWFTDYVYELFEAKTKLKGGDAVNYSLAKAKLNSL